MIKQLRRTILLCLGLCWLTGTLSAQLDQRSFEAVRTNAKIKVDGVLDPAEWSEAQTLTDFIQRRPAPGEASEKKTEVYFLYDNDAVYIAAKLYEKKEDVFNLLTNRDNVGNADYFGVVFDPYQAGLNGVGLVVTVAGVQYDTRYSNGGNERIWRNDEDWNAVWWSATQVYDDYWTVEYRIPYAVLRFNSKSVQDWGINFIRRNSSNNETSYWNPIDPEINGFLNQSGVVKDITDVKAPTRLFFYPYTSTVISRSTENGVGTPQLNGGMDIKYGINDAFTLDMTLIPDFSGVRSDNQVLNLSPFEVRFDEQRQFFTEGVELFNKAGLFYSRRIGATFGHRSGALAENEEITYSPQAAQLLNASKITGRTNSGLGIGFFNALTDRTLLEVEDSETGEKREIEGDPVTNFNVIVLDQNLKNNSSVTFTNTSVLRGKEADDANVSGLNFSLNDNQLNWRVSGFYGYSQIFSFDEETGERELKSGYKYNLSIRKTRGNLQFGIRRNVESDDYDINDLGFLRRPNKVEHRADISYNQFKPKGIFNSWTLRLNGNYDELYAPRSFARWGTNLNFNGQLRNFWWITAEIGGSPESSYDFFEARQDGYVFERPGSHTTNFSVRTDGRKRFRVVGRLRFWRRPEWDQQDRFINVSARLRIGERAEISHNLDFARRLNERGYATRLYDENDNLEQVVIGRRDVRNITNTLNAQYIFTNRMGLTFRMRHYWSRVEYDNFFQLTEDDRLINSEYTGIDSETSERLHDRNFNTFNIDMEYNWQFAPGSEIRAIWKRSILTDDRNTGIAFFDNFGDTVGAPNFDTLTIRLVYFIDYLDIRKMFRKK